MIRNRFYQNLEFWGVIAEAETDCTEILAGVLT